MSDRKAKQVIVIRRDLGMSRGKEIAQGAHASVKWLSDRLFVTDDGHFSGTVSAAEQQWLQGSFTKVVVQVPDEEALMEVFNTAYRMNVMAKMIEDAGRTEFGGVPTRTAVAIGPDWTDLVDLVTGKLELY